MALGEGQLRALVHAENRGRLGRILGGVPGSLVIARAGGVAAAGGLVRVRLRGLLEGERQKLVKMEQRLGQRVIEDRRSHRQAESPEGEHA